VKKIAKEIPFQKILAPLSLFVFLVLLLEYLINHDIVQAYLLPRPSEVWWSLTHDTVEYFEATQTTLIEAIAGLALSVVVGISFAALLSVSKWVEATLYPYAIFFQTVPLISIAPVLVIWFGYGIPTVIISAFIVSLFPIIINTLAGIRATDPALQDLFSLYGSTRWQRLMKLRIPYAIPQIISGVKISSGLAMIGAIVGEFIAGGGLGGLIDVSRTQQRLDKVFSAVLIASLLGILMMLALHILTITAFRRWRDLKA